MVYFPPCKINLGLRVLAQRPDGYHTIETCFYPVPWTDVLELVPSREFRFASGGLVIPGKEEGNICLKAWRLLRDHHEAPPVQMHLHKVIPAGAGLGGGSSDAASVLMGLNEIFSLNISHGLLLHYAGMLGSDCPFFMHPEPSIGTGRGEILTPSAVSLAGRYLIIIKPDIPISTAEAFRNVTPSADGPSVAELLGQPVEKWSGSVVNVFESSVFESHPALAEIKKTLYRMGAVYASMSGSGSSLFGIFTGAVSLPAEFSHLKTFQGFL